MAGRRSHADRHVHLRADSGRVGLACHFPIKMNDEVIFSGSDQFSDRWAVSIRSRAQLFWLSWLKCLLNEAVILLFVSFRGRLRPSLQLTGASQRLCQSASPKQSQPCRQQRLLRHSDPRNDNSGPPASPEFPQSSMRNTVDANALSNTFIWSHARFSLTISE
jgi:hypothetical protein